MRKSLPITLVAILLIQLTLLPGCVRRQDESESASSHTAAAGTDDCLAAGTSDNLRKLTVPATKENVRLIGRTCSSDDVTWLPQSGSAVEFTVTATRVEIEVAGDSHVRQDESLRPRLAVLVDNTVILDDIMSEPTRTVEAFASDSPQSHIIKIIHLSEARRGAVGVKSITVTSDAADPVAPTVAKDLSIEFIGDSITCAYGVEAAGYDEPFKTTTENFMKSYAYLAAQALDADYATVCYSGHGIVSGWTDGPEKNEDMLLPPLYGIVAKEYPQPWNTASRDYDVVVINLGTNDFTYTSTDEARMREFSCGYADFLAQVREHNPNAHIVCTLGTMGCQELYPCLEQAVDDFRASTGDDRITCYLSQEVDVAADGVGTMGHPNAVTQQKSADRLVEVIRESVGTAGDSAGTAGDSAGKRG